MKHLGYFVAFSFATTAAHASFISQTGTQWRKGDTFMQMTHKGVPQGPGESMVSYQTTAHQEKVWGYAHLSGYIGGRMEGTFSDESESSKQCSGRIKT